MEIKVIGVCVTGGFWLILTVWAILTGYERYDFDKEKRK